MRSETDYIRRFEDEETGDFQLPLFQEIATVKHHVMFTKRKQNKYPHSKKLREIFQVPNLLPDEKDLHAEVEPPIVPSKALAITAIRFLDAHPSRDPVKRLDDFTEELWDIARTSESYVGDEAFALASNLEMQRQFIGRTHYLGELAILGGNHEKCE